MNRARFDRLVRRAVMKLPAEFRARLDNVVISVRDRPSPRLLREMGEESLLGVYIGTPLTERHPDDLFSLPDQIVSFQRPIEAECDTDADIVEQIRITVVHEIGHFFGLTDEEIEAILGP